MHYIPQGLRDFDCNDTPPGDSRTPDSRREGLLCRISLAHLGNTVIQRLLESVSPSHGRILIYVWAIEQDEHSKRIIPVPAREGIRAGADGERCPSGQDVFVPWVLSSDNAHSKVSRGEQAQNVPSDAIRRYYHMFSKDELRGLVLSAGQELGLKVGPPALNEAEDKGSKGVEIIVSGWERSNYYIELRRWQR